MLSLPTQIVPDVGASKEVSELSQSARFISDSIAKGEYVFDVEYTPLRLEKRCLDDVAHLDKRPMALEVVNNQVLAQVQDRIYPEWGKIHSEIERRGD